MRIRYFKRNRPQNLDQTNLIFYRDVSQPSETLQKIKSKLIKHLPKIEQAEKNPKSNLNVKMHNNFLVIDGLLTAAQMLEMGLTSNTYRSYRHASNFKKCHPNLEFEFEYSEDESKSGLIDELLQQHEEF